MEITFVNEYYPPYVTGGTELFLQSLAEFLVGRGNKVKVICTLQDGLKEKERQGEVEIHRIKSSPIRVGHRYQFPGLTFYWNHFNRAVRSKVKEVAKNSDIVYINNSRHISLAPFQAAREMNKKIVFDVHDYWPICFKKDMFRNENICRNRSAWECSKCISSQYKIPILSPFVYPFMFFDYSLRKKNISFDKAVCHSEWMKKMLPFKTEVIPYPIREKPRGVKPKSLDSTINLLYMGRIQKQKGVLIFPEMARMLNKKGVDFTLSFMGSGDLENRLKKEMKDMPVKFYGWVSDFEKKKEIFSKSHLLLTPSIWAEPFGMIVIEAMSFATPSLVSNFGGLKEIVEKNKSGKSTKPTAKNFADEISKITKSDYNKMSRNCLSGIKNYDKLVIMKKYLNLFENLI